MYTVAPAERMIFLCAAFPAEQSSPCSPWLGLHAAMFLMLQKTSRELRASFPERSHLLPPGKGQQWRQAAAEHSPVLEWQITLDRCAARTKQKEQERRRENSWKWQELGSRRNLHSKLTAKKCCYPWKSLQIPPLLLSVSSGGGLPNQFSSWDDAVYWFVLFCFFICSHAQRLLKAVCWCKAGQHPALARLNME